MNFHFKSEYTIQDLLNIVNILRSDEGCPWDKQQTHQSLRKNFIEETYEVIEAIDNNDTNLLLEELGDVLLQVAFHAQLESEIGNFDFDDVADGICKKLIIRHPHVFAQTEVKDINQVLENWESIKQKTKNQNSQLEAINAIAKTLPALMRTYKVLKKATKILPQLNDQNLIIKDLNEKTSKLTEFASNQSNYDNCESAIGDLLFSVVKLAVCLEIDAEQALNDACKNFINKL